MVLNGVVNVSTDALSGLIIEAGRIGLWLQTLGVIIIFWIAFQLISLIVNRKKSKALYNIENKLKVLEKKIDKLSSKK